MQSGGYFLEPTVFADIAPDAVIAQEEIFGPVLAVIKVENFKEGPEGGEQHRVRPDGRGLHVRSRAGSIWRGRNSTSAICI